MANDTSQPKAPRKYVALTGIHFEGLKGKPRVEAGKEIPAGVPQKELDDLVDLGAIKEA